ncbi:MAG: hypothetical protein AAFP28_02855 [Pseudomonadota bacterium]
MKTLATALILSLTAASASALMIDPQFPTLTFPEPAPSTSTQGPAQPLILLPEDK